MSRWAAGRYQLLVLSNHYQDSSEQLADYINKIERKISLSSEDIPECIVEKIRAQSAKARVYMKLFSFPIGFLNPPVDI